MLYGELSPEDLEDVVINIYSDADWKGDGETSKSIAGFWVELYPPRSGRFRRLSWQSVLHASTSSPTAESETTAASYAMRRQSIPIQIMFEEATGR